MKKQREFNGDLSEDKRSATSVLMSWIKDKKVEVFCSANGLDNTRKAILEDLKKNVGHGISVEKFQFYESAFMNAKDRATLVQAVGNAYLCGAGLSMR